MRRKVTLAVATVLAMMPVSAFRLRVDPKDWPGIITQVEDEMAQIQAQLAKTIVADEQRPWFQGMGNVAKSDVPVAAVEETKLAVEKKPSPRSARFYQIDGEGDYKMTLDIPRVPIKDMSKLIPHIRIIRGYLVIRGPVPGGLFREWNEKPDAEPQSSVQSGDLIMEVNKVRGSCDKLFAALQKETHLVIRLLRQPLVITANTELKRNVRAEILPVGGRLGHIEIRRLLPGGPFFSWNDSEQAKDSNQLVRPGDRIMHVNGMSGTAEVIFKKLSVPTQDLVVLLCRQPLGATERPSVTPPSSSGSRAPFPLIPVIRDLTLDRQTEERMARQRQALRGYGTGS